MKAISDELIRITTLIGVDYQRAASLSESATITHYKDQAEILVIYAGFGNATLEAQDQGALAYQTVDVTLYVMKRKAVTDELAENIDTVLDSVATVCQQIREQYDTLFPISYTLEYNTTDPDLLVGYLMTFQVVIDAPVCP